MKLFVSSQPRHIIPKIGVDAYTRNYGFLAVWREGSTPANAQRYGVPWAIDNYAFSDFDPYRYMSKLIEWRGIPDCKWCAAPDVVGDAVATLVKFYQWNGFISSLGYPLALVAQDGLERLAIPWQDFSCLFIGGSTEWKLSSVAAGIVREAKARNKWVHIGRVNSARRIRYAQSLNADSVDGSSYATLKFKNIEHLPYLESRQPLLLEAA